LAVSRYNTTPIIDIGRQYGTSEAVNYVRAAIKDKQIPVETVILRGNQRLDTLAGEIYGDSRYWWVLAAASNIGWGLQVPAGTVLSVPNLQEILNILR
jgi:hypothetical protein